MSMRTVKEVVGFVGVVGGMVFVGLEIRQNNRLAQATAYQEVGLRAAGVWSGILHDEDAAELLEAAQDSTRWGEFSEVDWFRLRASVMSGLRAWESVELQIEAGILPADASTRLGYDVNYWPYLQRV